MKFGLVAALALGADAHYIFQTFSVGNTKTTAVRKNTNYNSPVTSLSSNDLRCNVGGASGATTVTVPVKAGDSFTFTTDVAVYHQGPISLYMSRAPGSANDYDGSGDWFKIYDWGPTFSGGQASWPLRSKCILSGRAVKHLHRAVADFPSHVHVYHSQVHQGW